MGVVNDTPANFEPSPSNRFADIDQELNHHVDLLTAEFESEGLSPEAARVAARRRFGDIESIRLQCHAIAREESIMRHWKTIVITAAFVVVSLIALLMANAQRHAALMARDRAQAVEQMLVEALRANDPAASGREMTIRDVLENTEIALADAFADDPENVARIRAVIEEARAKMQLENPE